MGHEVARSLGVKCVFAEKVQGSGVDATGKPNTVLAMRRFKIAKGDRIAQIVIARVERAEIAETAEVAQSERGEGGFGSTGVKQ